MTQTETIKYKFHTPQTIVEYVVHQATHSPTIGGRSCRTLEEAFDLKEKIGKWACVTRRTVTLEAITDDR